MSRQGSPYPPSGGLQAATVLVKAGLSFSAAAELETMMGDSQRTG